MQNSFSAPASTRRSRGWRATSQCHRSCARTAGSRCSAAPARCGPGQGDGRRGRSESERGGRGGGAARFCRAGARARELLDQQAGGSRRSDRPRRPHCNRVTSGLRRSTLVSDARTSHTSTPHAHLAAVACAGSAYSTFTCTYSLHLLILCYTWRRWPVRSRGRTRACCRRWSGTWRTRRWPACP
jgi:hypothetical protein